MKFSPILFKHRLESISNIQLQQIIKQLLISDFFHVQKTSENIVHHIVVIALVFGSKYFNVFLNKQYIIIILHSEIKLSLLHFKHLDKY